jgi:hypothetical protein
MFQGEGITHTKSNIRKGIGKLEVSWNYIVLYTFDF